VDVRWMTGFLDSPSRAAEPFWSAVTGTTLSARRGPGGVFATLVPPDGDAYLHVQMVGSPPPRTHLDLHVTDVPVAAAEAVALGARVILDEGTLVVLHSPGGLAFCLVRWAGEAVVPAVPRWRSVVDQVSLDIPAAKFEAEAGFWATLTGWPRRRANLPEFDYLQRAPGMPLRLLLQRTGSGPAGMHLDLACAEVDAEVARHVGLGAQVVRRVPGDWTTLRDPAGREYCLTARTPAPRAGGLGEVERAQRAD
jgi:hypothetical protein